MSVKLSVTGVKEIDAVLKGMPLQLQDRVLKTAHADAAKPLVQVATTLAPLGKTGNLKRSIGVERISMKKIDAIGLVQVGPRRRSGYKGIHGHLVEFGTTSRETKGKKSMPAGINRGLMPAKPFMEPAFNQTKSLIEAAISVSVGKKLNDFIKRTVKK